MGQIKNKVKKSKPKRANKGAAWSKFGSKFGSRAGSMAYKAFKMAKQIKSLINVEEKHYDVSGNPTISSSGSLVTLNSPQQGTTDSMRIGDSIKCQSLELNYHLYPNGAMTATNTYLARVIIFEDKQNKVSAVSDIIDSTYIATGYAPIGLKDFDRRFETKVLYDELLEIDLITNMGKSRRVNLPLGHHTQFEAASTTINTGAYKMLLLSSVPSASVNDVPAIIYTSRLHYTDD